jgi:hypothetical protein
MLIAQAAVAIGGNVTDGVIAHVALVARTAANNAAALRPRKRHNVRSIRRPGRLDAGAVCALRSSSHAPGSN